MKLLIAGAGGFAKECIQIVRDCGHTAIGCLIPLDDALLPRKSLMDVPLILEEKESYDLFPVILGVGIPALRRKLDLKFPRYDTLHLEHPSAICGRSSRIEERAILCIGVIVTECCHIGRAALLDKGVIVSHDVKIGDYAVLSPGVRLGGGVEIGEGTTLGMGAIVLPRIKIGKWATIGAGAVVTQDVPDNATAVGVPAKVIKMKEEGWHL